MPGHKSALRTRLIVSFAIAAALAAAALPRTVLRGQDVDPTPSEVEAITVRADYSQEWREEGGSVAMLRGRCRIVQGDLILSAGKMVLWHHAEKEGDERIDHLAIYLEDEFAPETPDVVSDAPPRIVHLTTREGIGNEITRRVREDNGPLDPLFQRAAELVENGGRSGGIVPAQFGSGRGVRIGDNRKGSISGGNRNPLRGLAQAPARSGLPAAPAGPGARRVRVFPRSAVPYNVLSYQNAKTTPPEQIWVLTGGINLLIDGIKGAGPIDLAADRVVIWTQMQLEDGEDFRQESLQAQDQPFQVYLEGNIVIRQDQNVIRAARAVYDARENRGILLNAELKSFLPMTGASVRIRADQIRQLSEKSFQARNAWSTGSQFGKPGYRLQSSEIFLDYRYADPWLGSGRKKVDPVTGARTPAEVPWITSLDNTLFIEDAPVFYSPFISGPADDPNIPLRAFNLRTDRIFGTQVRATWDIFKLTGMNDPDGLEWDLYTDYLSMRGPAIGTGTRYQGDELFGAYGRYFGDGLAYYIHDSGNDNLGSDRRNLQPESKDRYRLQWHHRSDVNENTLVLGELGLLSDRNFLESYYEFEFDRQKDVETLGYIQQRLDNFGWSALLRPQLNDFENTTEWLPRGDLYLLSEPLLGGAVTWSTHTSAGYGQLRRAVAPTDPNDVFTPIPYIVDAGGAVLMTRHELNAPFNLGPLQLTPFVLGEAAFWGEDFNGDSIDRFVGAAGLRSSLMFSRIFPYVQSDLFNLNGLAHKIRLEAEYSLVGSSRNLNDIPQYNEIDDDAQERFRQRYVTNSFNGGPVPATFDPRFYAVRTGAGLSVTAPYHELVDDQQVVRMAIRQRLQTKVGPPDRLRIKDWMTLDLEASFFPDAARDNFGKDFGLLGGRYQWNVGDRTSILANALYDMFDPALHLWNIGVTTQRGERGSLYVGLRQVSGGPVDSDILTASYSYRMSPKWISTMGTSFDLREGRNIGQSVTVTRVGADFLVHVGGNVDTSKGNVGLQISVEPRFGRFVGFNGNPRLGNLLTPQTQ